jgi:hypothetical protein
VQIEGQGTILRRIDQRTLVIHDVSFAVAERVGAEIEADGAGDTPPEDAGRAETNGHAT